MRRQLRALDRDAVEARDRGCPVTARWLYATRTALSEILMEESTDGT
jgi:hypothetical protein